MGTCEEVKPGPRSVLEGTVPVAFLGFGVDFLNSDVHIPCAQDARTSVRCNVSTQWGNQFSVFR
jgi:hypothetical protein